MRSLFWCSRPELDWKIAKTTAALNQRMAEYMDTTMEYLERELPPGQFDPHAIFLPLSIIDCGRREGFVTKTYNAKND